MEKKHGNRDDRLPVKGKHGVFLCAYMHLCMCVCVHVHERAGAGVSLCVHVCMCVGAGVAVQTRRTLAVIYSKLLLGLPLKLQSTNNDLEIYY